MEAKRPKGFRKFDKLMRKLVKVSPKPKPEPPMAWMKRLRRLAVSDWGFSAQQAADTVASNWFPYFERGLSPADALSELFKNDE